MALPEPHFYHGDKRDVCFSSIVPWCNFTGLSHPCSLRDKYDSIVRMTLGRYEERGGKLIAPLDIQGHHGFIDGLQIAWFLNEFDRFAIG